MSAEDVRKVGCCGAYCKTCGALAEGACRGCKLGYADGKRDIDKARCRIKICCFKERGLETCADCPEIASCETVQALYEKNGYKYKKYKQSIEFIMEHGYEEFLAAANHWTGPYGKI